MGRVVIAKKSIKNNKQTHVAGDGKVKRFYFIFLFIAFVTPVGASAVVDLTGLVRLDEMSVHSDKGRARVVFRFAKDWRPQLVPLFFEKSIQFDIEGTYVNPSKRSFNFGGEHVKEILAYQINPTTVRVRIFTKGDPRDYTDSWKISSAGNLATLVLDQPFSLMEEPIKILPVEKAPKQKRVADEASTEKATEDATVRILAALREAREQKAVAENKADKPVSSGLVENDSLPIAITSRLAPSGGLATSDVGEGFLNYKEPSAPEPPSFRNMAVKTASALAFTLAAVFILAWLAKKYMGKVNNAFGSSPVVNVLATGSIGIKKHITVVDVGGETLILGVSDESITMLKAVDDEEVLEKLRKSAVSGSFINKKPVTAKKSEGILSKLVSPLRIGKVKASPKSIEALFDEGNPDTFAGSLNSIANEKRIDQNREELLRKLANSIKDKNKKLRLA